MRKSLVVALTAAVLAAAASLHASQATSSGPGLFTRAQAAAGSKLYAAQCSKCHGANLEGVSAPALRGSGSGLSGESLGEAYAFMSTQMPAGNPGSLTPTQYADIMAYILSRNGHQPGSTTLTAGSAKSSKAHV